MSFEQPSAENSSEKLSMQERLDQRDKHLKVAIVKENPGIGEISVDEFYSFDPEREGGNTCAATAFVTLFPNEGRFTKVQLIHDLSEQEIEDEETGEYSTEYPDEEVSRATATVDNLLNAGLLEIRNDRVYLNMEMVRR